MYIYRESGSYVSKAMPFQSFRVVDGKIVEEDEATLREREKKVLEGILMPVSYKCRLCDNMLCATTKVGLYNHWKEMHCDKKYDHVVDENSDSETGKNVEMFPVELSSSSQIHEDMRMEPVEEEDEPSSDKTFLASANPLELDHEDWKVFGSRYYPKDIYVVKINVIHKNLDFKISPSTDKRFPAKLMQELKNKIPEEVNQDSYDCVKNVHQSKPNLESSAYYGPFDSRLISDDRGPMPTLSSECCSSPPYHKQIAENINDTEAVLTEEKDDPEKFRKKRKNCGLPNKNDPPKRHTKKTKQSSRQKIKPNLLDSMRRGEKLWLCKKCEDYLTTLDLLKWHVAKVHNEDPSKINRFNIVTWDLEIARTFTSPHEIETQYKLDLLEPANHIDQVCRS